MSKSLKNTVSVSQMLDNYTPNQFRMLCLLTHYRNREHCVKRLVLVSQPFVFPGFVFLLLFFFLFLLIWFLFFFFLFFCSSSRAVRGRDGSVGRASDTKARHNTDVGSSPWCSEGFPPPRVNFQCRLSYGVCTDPVCKCDASTSVHTFKIPNSRTLVIVWTHENTALPGRNG